LKLNREFLRVEAVLVVDLLHLDLLLLLDLAHLHEVQLQLHPHHLDQEAQVDHIIQHQAKEHHLLLVELPLLQ